MGIFKTRKNKKFNHTPIYYQGDGNPYEIKHKFDEFRKTVGPSGGIKTKLNNALEDLKNSNDRRVNRRILIIVAILILLFLFIIEFDLSIFFS